VVRVEVYPIMEEETLRLRCGQLVTIRSIRPDDAPALVTAMAALSEQSRYLRFHTPRAELTQDLLEYLTDIDHHDHEALVAHTPGAPDILAVARFVRDPHNPASAEAAVVVADAWQRRGLGARLLAELIRRAAEVEISQFTAEILAENTPTLALARHLGPPGITHDGTTTVSVHLAPPPPQPSDSGPVTHLDANALRRALATAASVLPPGLLGVVRQLSTGLTHTLTLSVPPRSSTVRKRAS
jgi:RimJ/RimL family protein N-acetyltransferase